MYIYMTEPTQLKFEVSILRFFGEMSSFMESKAAFDARLKELNLADLKDLGLEMVKCHNLQH